MNVQDTTLSDDERAEFARLLPAATDRQPLPRRRLHRARILAAVRGGPAPRRRLLAPALAAGALAATVAVATAGGLVVNRDAAGPAARPTATAGPASVTSLAELVRHLDAIGPATVPAAGRGTSGPVRNDQFLYVQESTSPNMREIWLSVDGTRPSAYSTDLGRTLLGLGTSPAPPGRSALDAAILSPTYRRVDDLRVSPEALLAAIERQGEPGASRTWQAFARIRQMLRAGGMFSPRGRALLYHAATLIPGVTFVKDAGDDANRHGAGIELPESGRKQVIIVEPTLGGLLAEQDVPRSGTGGRRTYQAATVVDKAGQRPSAEFLSRMYPTGYWWNQPLELPVELGSGSTVRPGKVDAGPIIPFTNGTYTSARTRYRFTLRDSGLVAGDEVTGLAASTVLAIDVRSTREPDRSGVYTVVAAYRPDRGLIGLVTLLEPPHRFASVRAVAGRAGSGRQDLRVEWVEEDHETRGERTFRWTGTKFTAID